MNDHKFKSYHIYNPLVTTLTLLLNPYPSWVQIPTLQATYQHKLTLFFANLTSLVSSSEPSGPHHISTPPIILYF